MIRELVAAQLGASVVRTGSVGGGSISDAWWCGLEDGRHVFVKTAPHTAPAGMIEQEVLSLRRMRATRTVRVPEVLAAGADWLILEWLEPAVPTRQAWRTLGTQLAAMHREQREAYGWEADNFIGPLPQPNGLASDWAEFWRARRLRPQIARAERLLDGRTLSLLQRLLDSLDERLGPATVEGASLLHGDLWSGNVQFVEGGAALVDPACSYGHREVDLAMAALFGGFAEEFRVAYESAWPLLRGASQRRPLYQLYYLLVHVNLFGGPYVEQTRALVHAVA